MKSAKCSLTFSSKCLHRSDSSVTALHQTTHASRASLSPCTTCWTSHACACSATLKSAKTSPSKNSATTTMQSCSPPAQLQTATSTSPELKQKVPSVPASSLASTTATHAPSTP